MRINRIKLKTEMVKQDITNAELAKKAGVSLSTVSSIRGGRSCSKGSAVLVARALSMSVGELLENESGE